MELFSEKPKKAVTYLQENGLLGKEPKDVAKFLLEDERLDKTMIGEYLGDPHEFNVAVMHSYTDQLDFSGLFYFVHCKPAPSLTT